MKTRNSQLGVQIHRSTMDKANDLLKQHCGPYDIFNSYTYLGNIDPELIFVIENLPVLLRDMNRKIWANLICKVKQLIYL